MVTKCKSCGFMLDYDGEKCLICGGELEPYDATKEELDNQRRELAYKKQQLNNNNYTPKCPLCQSPNIKQISVAKRAAHGYAFGLFSNTVRSQWECLNCGNKF